MRAGRKDIANGNVLMVGRRRLDLNKNGNRRKVVFWHDAFETHASTFREVGLEIRHFPEVTEDRLQTSTMHRDELRSVRELGHLCPRLGRDGRYLRRQWMHFEVP